VDENDHCETCAQAYEDIAPILRCGLAVSLLPLLPAASASCQLHSSCCRALSLYIYAESNRLGTRASHSILRHTHHILYCDTATRSDVVLHAAALHFSPIRTLCRLLSAHLYLRQVSHYTDDTHIYMFPLAVALSAIINIINSQFLISCPHPCPSWDCSCQQTCILAAGSSSVRKQQVLWIWHIRSSNWLMTEAVILQILWLNICRLSEELLPLPVVVASCCMAQ
jgi:hypothetical protein